MHSSVDPYVWCVCLCVYIVCTKSSMCVYILCVKAFLVRVCAYVLAV